MEHKILKLMFAALLISGSLGTHVVGASSTENADSSSNKLDEAQKVLAELSGGAIPVDSAKTEESSDATLKVDAPKDTTIIKGKKRKNKMNKMKGLSYDKKPVSTITTYSDGTISIDQVS